MISDYDERQLKLMLSLIHSYNKRNIELLTLINDLGSLLDVLEQIETSWKENFRGWVWDLEQVYAVSLDTDKEFFSEDELEIIKNALKEMESLIIDKI